MTCWVSSTDSSQQRSADQGIEGGCIHLSLSQLSYLSLSLSLFLPAIPILLSVCLSVSECRGWGWLACVYICICLSLSIHIHIYIYIYLSLPLCSAFSSTNQQGCHMARASTPKSQMGRKMKKNWAPCRGKRNP